MGRLGTGWTTGQGGHDRDSGYGACRPPRGRDGGNDRKEHGRPDRPPRQGEAVYPVGGDRLESGFERQPAGQPHHGSDHGGRDAHRRTVGQHDQAHVAVSGPQRAQHAEGA